MPLYEYSDPETGVKVELARPVEDRNKEIILKRLKDIPDSLVVFGSQPTEEQSFDKKILEGYYRKEEQEGSRFRSGYSKKTIAKVFAEARSL